MSTHVPDNLTLASSTLEPNIPVSGVSCRFLKLWAQGFLSPLLHNPALALAIGSPPEQSTSYIVSVWILMAHFPSSPQHRTYTKYPCIPMTHGETLGFSNTEASQQTLRVAGTPSQLQRASSGEAGLEPQRWLSG